MPPQPLPGDCRDLLAPRGVAQVSEAVMSKDPTTQQNAALDEPMAAAATSLPQHADEWVGTTARSRF